MRKRIYVAYTGGTIGMKRVDGSYAPSPGYLPELLATMPELRDPRMPEYVLSEYEPLLDSANMSPADWVMIAQDIGSRDAEYDGFLVLHGTDTMAYTSSALAFLLQGLRKTVVVTGSQIPMSEIRNDARENVITGLMIAAESGIPEVCLSFGGRILRGCRSIKADAEGLVAFDSPNFPALGTAGISIDVQRSFVLPPASEAMVTVPNLEPPVVGAVRLFPGIRAELLANVLRPPLAGLVLEAYGAGNGPDRDHAFLEALTEASARGVVVVVCTQCFRGGVNLSTYETGSALAKTGAISGYDMTVEAALTKLAYLLGLGLSPDRVRETMQRDLRGGNDHSLTEVGFDFHVDKCATFNNSS